MEEKKRESYVEGRAWWRIREGKEKERELHPMHTSVVGGTGCNDHKVL